MAGGRPPVCLPPAAPLLRGPCGLRSPPPEPGGAPLIAEPPRPAPPLVPAQLGSLTDSRSPRRAGGLKGARKVTPSRRRRRSPPLEGEAAGPRRRQQLGGGRRLRGRSARVSLPPRCPERDSVLRRSWLRAGQDDVESSRTARGKEKKKKKKISARRLGNFAAGRPRSEQQALKLWPPRVPALPRRGPAGASSPAPGERSRRRPAALALLRAPGQARGSRRGGERRLSMSASVCLYRRSAVCRKNYWRPPLSLPRVP